MAKLVPVAVTVAPKGMGWPAVDWMGWVKDSLAMMLVNGRIEKNSHLSIPLLGAVELPGNYDWRQGQQADHDGNDQPNTGHQK